MKKRGVKNAENHDEINYAVYASQGERQLLNYKYEDDDLGDKGRGISNSDRKDAVYSLSENHDGLDYAVYSSQGEMHHNDNDDFDGFGDGDRSININNVKDDVGYPILVIMSIFYIILNME
jgi:hypothetical protein